MDKLQKYLPEQRFLILLNRFIIRYDESQCNKDKVVRDAYLFCVGYFFKYQQDYENPYLRGPSNIIAILSSALLSPSFYAIPSSISLDRILYFYKFIVEYIIWNEYEVETVFRTHKLSFRKDIPYEMKDPSSRKKKRL